MLDFAIVGWPKCGTSSLYHWLNEHPSIESSSPKEPFYLMDLNHPLINKNYNWHLNGAKGLEKFFSPDSNKIKFEATTHYYYQETALNYFANINKEAKIIFITRNPAERILSSFNYTKENLAVIKRELTFNHYVDLLLSDQKKKLDQYFYSNSSLYIAKQELQLSDYIYWKKLWKDAVGEERITTLQFDTLKKNPEEVLRKIAEIAEFDSSFYDGFNFYRKNETISITSYSIHRLAIKLNSIIPNSIIPNWIKQCYINLQADSNKKNKISCKKGINRLKKYFKTKKDSYCG